MLLVVEQKTLIINYLSYIIIHTFDLIYQGTLLNIELFDSCTNMYNPTFLVLVVKYLFVAYIKMSILVHT